MQWKHENSLNILKFFHLLLNYFANLAFSKKVVQVKLTIILQESSIAAPVAETTITTIISTR